MPIKDYIPLRRPCKKCDEMFVPSGKFNRVCVFCMEKNYRLSTAKRRATFKKTIKRKQSNRFYDC